MIGEALVTVLAANTWLAAALPIGRAGGRLPLHGAHGIAAAGETHGGTCRVGVVAGQTGLAVFTPGVVATADADATGTGRAELLFAEFTVLRIAIAFAS